MKPEMHSTISYFVSERDHWVDQVGVGKACDFHKVQDILHNRNISLITTFDTDMAVGKPRLSSVIAEVTGAVSAWSLFVKIDNLDNGLKMLDPIAITYNGADFVNHTARYSRSGELLHLEVESLLEVDDLGVLWSDPDSNTRFYMDFTDGNHWWVSESDKSTKTRVQMYGGEVSDLSTFDTEFQLIGSIKTNSDVDSNLVYCAKVDNSVIISLVRIDGQIKTIVVPIQVNIPNYEGLTRGEIKPIVDFPFHLFKGYVSGDKIPPEESFVGII